MVVQVFGSPAMAFAAAGIVSFADISSEEVGRTTSAASGEQRKTRDAAAVSDQKSCCCWASPSAFAAL